MNVLPYVYECCMTNAFKEKWQWPPIDPEINLYVDKYFKKKKKDTSKNVLGGNNNPDDTRDEEESPNKDRSLLD